MRYDCHFAVEGEEKHSPHNPRSGTRCQAFHAADCGDFFVYWKSGMKKDTIKITISGNKCSGKTILAHALEELFDAKGIEYITFDHELFSFRDDFNEQLAKTNATIERRKPRVAIISVCTSDNKHCELDINISPACNKLLRLLVDLNPPR